MKPFTLVIAATGTFLAACATLNTSDPSSRYYELPPTTTIVVNQDVAIPAGSARVLLQEASAGSKRQGRFEPFCELEVNDVFETRQVVRPGRFRVTRVAREPQYGALEAPVMLAGAGVGGLGLLAGMGFDDDGPLVLKRVRMRLQSAEQPNVRELMCAAGWAFASDAVYPTLAEMQGALGALISIETR